MPELPEVETLRRLLEPLLVGKRVAGCRRYAPRLRRALPQRIPGKVQNEQIVQVGRRGKYLLLRFSQPGFLIIHLGMTGGLRMESDSAPAKSHEHWKLLFTDGTSLRYTDPRRFGSIWFAPEKDGEVDDTVIAKLGPEPLEAGFSAEILRKKAQGRVLSVKSFLLDQSVIAGVGNIYASEALFLARIHPETPIGELSLNQWNGLCQSVRKVLLASIKAGSTCVAKKPLSQEAVIHFELSLQVYERAGQPCHQCRGGMIQGARLGGRSTYWCPICQPEG